MSIYDDLAALISQESWFVDQRIYFDGLPEGPDDAVCVNSFPMNFERVQTNRHPLWTVYGIELRVRATKPEVCLARCESLMEKMDGLTNITINGTLYREIFLTTTPRIVSREPGGEVTYSIGFTVTRRGMV